MVNSEGEGGSCQGQELAIHKHYKRNNILLFLFIYFIFYSKIISVNVLCAFTLKQTGRVESGPGVKETA